MNPGPIAYQPFRSSRARRPRARGLGVAHYVRSLARPDVPEVALPVIDDWQGRGLGTLLLEVISARARQEGIKTSPPLGLPDAGVAPALRELLQIAARHRAGSSGTGSA
jgi:GNAT superfamily N-acetyltransferase